MSSVYNNDAGTNYNINAFQWLKLELKKRNLWNHQIGSALLQNEGNIKYLNVPDEVKSLFASCWDRDMEKLILANAGRQIWIDQGISLNIWFAGSDIKKLSNIYKLAWLTGHKATYYLRNKGASEIKKIEETKTPEFKEGAVCTMEEGCVSCQ